MKKKCNTDWYQLKTVSNRLGKMTLDNLTQKLF